MENEESASETTMHNRGDTIQKTWLWVSIIQIGFILLMVPLGRATERLVRNILENYSSYVMVALLLLGIPLFAVLCWISKVAVSSMNRYYWLIVTAVAIGIVYFVHLPVEAFHVLIYASVAISLMKAFPRLSDWKCIIFVNSISLIDETLQGLHPERFFDVRDLALNFLGCLAGLLLFFPLLQRSGELKSRSFLQAALATCRN